jgi:glutaredoxin-like protein NrdH
MPEKEKHVSIKIYSSSSCPQCAMTKRLYDRDGVAYESVMIDNNDAVQARLRADGHRQLPVVETATATWTGFQPELIKASIEHHKASQTSGAVVEGLSVS